MNNAELITALRQRSETKESELTFAWLYETQGAMSQAADALEAAEKRIAELEAQLPKEGEWIESNRRPRSAQFYCSVCHRTCYDIQPTRNKAWTKRCRYHYCPSCGARMKGKQEGER